ncbi:calcium/sodium antiporter [Aureibacter tunicatorum]|uniref:Cation:H+ antiporter n=1 Tax=Aureibacter tunicatorum TaxID=866807 RepID=A0AAE3XJJ1_9BACT|nr:calcium/sodium antiporter [Aureibacter tunicatorum]MDR6238052.1 cation:H+ antiporter [Aureibacter tunicatorum]BDD03085.1 sodium:calcium antiporter [Aureibacter tunicatorum]
MLTHIALLVIGLAILILGGEFLVRGACRIALNYKIPTLVVGLTVIAFGTSAPELFISTISALNGSSDLAVGNVIGSNICNLALVLGVTGLIYPIKVEKSSLTVDWPVTMGSSLLLYVFVKEGALEAYEGAIFIFLLIIYLSFTIYQGMKHSKEFAADDEVIEAVNNPYPMWKSFSLVILGMLGLYFGAEWFVVGSQNIALKWGVSERVVGVTVVALGTSLPELVTSVIAASKKQTDLALGNLLGSNIFNILSILGITSIIKTIKVSEKMINVDMVWMLAITALVFPLMLTRKKVDQVEGGVLIFVYLFYIYTVVIG